MPRLLRPRDDRPSRRAAEQRNEISPPHAPPETRLQLSSESRFVHHSKLGQSKSEIGSGTSDLGFARHVRCCPELRHLLAPQYLTKPARFRHSAPQEKLTYSIFCLVRGRSDRPHRVRAA